MIRKLRRTFILVNLSMLALILIIVFVSLGVSNYNQLQRESVDALARMLEQSRADPLGSGPAPRNNDGERSPFSVIQAFAVTIDGTGTVIEVMGAENTGVTGELLQNAVDAVLASDGEAGVLPDYALQYLVRPAGDGIKIAFTDRSAIQSSMFRLIAQFAVISAIALAAFFVLNLFLAGWVFRPVERAWNQQNQFTADASHELKTPLTVILANTGILLSHPGDTIERQRKWVEYIETEAQRMKGLVDDLLFLAKSDVTAARVVRQQVNLSDVVWSAGLPFESVAFENGVALHLEIEPDITLTGDTGQLKQLVAILADNACKYTEPGGDITIRLRRFQEKVRLTVHNTGTAIPEEQLPHLFKRFYRVDKARARALGGYGLGLSIARRITEQHKGKIFVKSGETLGTTFTVLLPFR